MTTLFPVRKACPACGKSMVARPDAAAEGRQRYLCTNCDEDPLNDPGARKWVDGPLRPPAK
ncbi:hypothetical protein [Bradyrhizobium sp. ARR65]|uniref:hypothetical protein n=1 Tax=Bradyrhizobium sp. ARR65 TaxID=1040989 RepID=UPI00046526C7|nr:hypothetical protein [Bradyrhizobium sp. ARR65]